MLYVRAGDACLGARGVISPAAARRPPSTAPAVDGRDGLLDAVNRLRDAVGELCVLAGDLQGVAVHRGDDVVHANEPGRGLATLGGDLLDLPEDGPEEGRHRLHPDPLG